MSVVAAATLGTLALFALMWGAFSFYVAFTMAETARGFLVCFGLGALMAWGGFFLVGTLAATGILSP